MSVRTLIASRLFWRRAFFEGARKARIRERRRFAPPSGKAALRAAFGTRGPGHHFQCLSKSFKEPHKYIFENCDLRKVRFIYSAVLGFKKRQPALGCAARPFKKVVVQPAIAWAAYPSKDVAGQAAKGSGMHFEPKLIAAGPD